MCCMLELEFEGVGTSTSSTFFTAFWKHIHELKGWGLSVLDDCGRT